MAFSEGKGIYGYNESVLPDGVIVAWKADNPHFYTIFRYWVRLSWFQSDKDFLVKVMEYWEKGRLDFTA